MLLTNQLTNKDTGENTTSMVEGKFEDLVPSMDLDLSRHRQVKKLMCQ